jgi:hypothetical protein
MIQKVDNDQEQCGANVKESADVAEHSTTFFDVTESPTMRLICIT